MDTANRGDLIHLFNESYFALCSDFWVFISAKARKLKRVIIFLLEKSFMKSIFGMNHSTQTNVGGFVEGYF